MESRVLTRTVASRNAWPESVSISVRSSQFSSAKNSTTPNFTVATVEASKTKQNYVWGVADQQTEGAIFNKKYCIKAFSSCLPAHQWLNKYTDQAEEQKPFWMPINSSCYLGICQTKKTDKEDQENEEITECKKTQEIDIFDLVNSVWVYLKPSEFAQFAKNNIVGAVMIFSAIFWVSF